MISKYRMAIRGLFLWVIIFILMPSGFYVLASDASGTEKSQEASSKRQAKLTEIEMKMTKRISVDFRETDIDDVLRSMADQANIDIIKSPKVVGVVSATLTNVPLDEALTNILAAHGYGYSSTENMIMVMPIADLETESHKRFSRVYRINYADVGELYKSLKTFLSPDGEIAFNYGTSNLMVTDTESKIAAIDAFIEEVDRRTPQIMIEARIYDVTSLNGLDLGFMWNAGKNTDYSPGGITDVGANPSGDINPFVTGAFESGISKTDGITGVLRLGFLDDSLDIDTLFKAQEQEINAQLLASPRILTLDNETALIQIIRQIPYQEITETSAGGQIGSTEFRDVGVMLEVTPHVTRDGYVRMHIRPEFSVVSGSVLVTGLAVSNPQPVVDSRSADTVTLIKSGETVVIGGLRKKEISQMIDKIPLLGDIPLLGYLFRFEGEEEIDSELLVFITPYIVDDPILTKEERSGLEATHVMMPPVTPLLRSEERCGVIDESYPELDFAERNKDQD